MSLCSTFLSLNTMYISIQNIGYSVFNILAHDSKSCGVTHESSILSRGTICTERNGLKIHCSQGHVASTPTSSTKVAFLFNFATITAG